MKRREFLLAVFATSLGALGPVNAAEETITVYKSAT